MSRKTIDAGFAALIELKPGEEGPRIPLVEQECVMGSDPAASTIAVDDPFVSPTHARLHKDAQGRWQIDDCASLNGTWIRVHELHVDAHAEILIGEQRIMIRILGHEDSTAN